MASPSRTNRVEQSPQRQASGVLATSNRKPANAGIYGDILGLQRTAGNMAVSRLLRSHTGGTDEDAPSSQAAAPLGKDNHGEQSVRVASTAIFPRMLNRHTSSPLGRPAVQAKLNVSQPGDSYEIEADQVAERVMRSSSTPHACARCQDEEETLHRKSANEAGSEDQPMTETPAPSPQVSDTEEEVVLVSAEAANAGATPPESSEQKEEGVEVSRKGRASSAIIADSNGANPDLERSLNASRGGGAALPKDVRAFFEPKFGADFSGVRVHVNGEAARMNKELNAQAFTHRQDIYFSEGQYSPDSSQGKSLLAHELTHVVQQGHGGGVRSVIQRKNGSTGAAPAQDSGYVFSITVNRVMGRDEFLLVALTQVFGMSRPEAQASIVERGWHWKDENSRGPTDADIKRGYKRVRISASIYRSMVGEFREATEKKEGGAGVKSTPGERKAKLKSLPQKERSKINAQTDKEFWDRTNYKPGQKLGQSKEDKQQAELWKDIRDEIMVEREKLDQLPEEIKSLIVPGDVAEPVDYKQLLRIAGKLKQLSSDDIQLYKLIAKALTTDLEAFERSVDIFIQFKEQYRASLEEQAQKALSADAQKPAEPTVEEKIAKTWEGFDESKFGQMSADQKEALARQVAAKQRDVYLEHMAEHPGEALYQAGRGIVRVDELGESIAKDVQEAYDGDKNAYARAAGGVGATGKAAGWLAAVAGIVYVALLFVPGVNVLELAVTSLALGIGAVVLSGVESELRIKSASQATTVEKLKTDTQKSAQAQVNLIVGVVLIVAGLVLKLAARIRLPGRLQNVGTALKMARDSFLKATGISTALEQTRASLLARLRGERVGLPEALTEGSAEYATLSKPVEAMTGDELVAKLVAGDKVLQELTGIDSTAAKRIQELAQTTPGKGAPEELRQSLLKALQDAPAEASKRVNDFLKKLDDAIAAVEKAESEEALKTAIDDAEKNLKPEEMGKQAAADQQAYLKEQIQKLARLKAMSDEELKAAAKVDPNAAHELVARYKLKPIAELKKLAEAGDETAKYALEEAKKAPNLAEIHQRPSNPATIKRLQGRLDAMRAELGIPKVGPSGEVTGGTMGVAETDLPLETNTFEGKSPRAGGTPDPTYKPPSEVTQAQGHAEQNIVGAAKKAIEAAKLTPDQMKGKTLWMLIDQGVCSTCAAGLRNPLAASGILKQFSLEFPELTIEITDIDSYSNSYRVWRIKNGAYVE